MSYPSQQLDQLTEKYNPLLILLQNRFFYTLVIRSKAILILRLIFVFLHYLFIYLFTGLIPISIRTPLSLSQATDFQVGSI